MLYSCFCPNTTCGAGMRVREFIRQIEGEGWTVRQRNGGHLELSHPDAHEVVIIAATPSDYRWHLNALAQMRRVLPPEPKSDKSGLRRIKRRPAPRPKPRPVAPIEMEPEEMPLPLPPRRIAGGPQDWRSPWSRLW